MLPAVSIGWWGGRHSERVYVRAVSSLVLDYMDSA
jgi:hypothetical protein